MIINYTRYIITRIGCTAVITNDYFTLLILASIVPRPMMWRQLCCAWEDTGSLCSHRLWKYPGVQVDFNRPFTSYKLPMPVNEDFLGSPCWHWTPDPPASASEVWGLQLQTTTPWQCYQKIWPQRILLCTKRLCSPWELSGLLSVPLECLVRTLLLWHVPITKDVT